MTADAGDLAYLDTRQLSMSCAYCSVVHPWLGQDRRRWWPTSTYAQCWPCTIRWSDRRARREPWWWRFLARRVWIAW